MEKALHANLNMFLAEKTNWMLAKSCHLHINIELTTYFNQRLFVL